MSTPSRRKELQEKWDREWERRKLKYNESVEAHPATELIEALTLLTLSSQQSETMREAVLYLLHRARDDDIGTGP